MRLRTLKISLKSYTNERIPVLGQLNVHVRYGEQHAALVLIVVAGEGPSLLGRNWLKYLKLQVDGSTVHAVAAQKTTDLTDLIHQHKMLFSGELGKIEPFRATLHIRADARPKFFKPRPVPFAIKTAIEDELDKLEASGAIKKLRIVIGPPRLYRYPRKTGSSAYAEIIKSQSTRNWMWTNILYQSLKICLRRWLEARNFPNWTCHRPTSSYPWMKTR